MATTPVLFPRKSHGQRSLVGYCPWGRKELDMTEQLHFHLLSYTKKKKMFLFVRFGISFLKKFLTLNINS